MSGGEIAAVCVLLGFGMFFFLAYSYIRRRCPQCGASFGLWKTGRKEYGFYTDQEEWKCRRCGHTMLREKEQGIGEG